MSEDANLKFGRPAARRRISRAGIALFLIASSGLAQAWLAPEGEASFGLSYQNVYTRDHLFSEGERRDRGHIRLNTIVVGLTYSFTDRLAAAASLPYVIGRYEGPNSNNVPGHEIVDDGSYHGNFTDLRLDLRYNLVEEPAMVTPFVSAIIPTWDYPTFGQSAPSSGLEQYLVGVSVGRRLDPILEAGFAQLRYSYAFVEEVRGISHDRSNADLEIGYFLTPSLGISVTGSYQKTHGGLDVPLPGTPAADAFRATPFFVHRDRLAQTNYLNVGGIVSYALTGSLEVFAVYQSTVWGRNFHAVQPGLAFGVNFGFSPRRVIRSFVRKSPTDERSSG
ncbi:MAG TPA: hypothetical protein VFW15_03280 [Thermoanaerobaculia bacterium]|nr:hypothetical protein [Thermoanaerobaculia bacterium]